MKIKLVSFTNYKLNLDIYEKSDIDFFSYLLLNLIKKKNNHILLDDVRKDMDIPDKIAYLFENSFYYLIENKLIVTLEDEYISCYLDDIKLTILGEECYDQRMLYHLVSNEYKEISLSPLDDSIVPLNDIEKCDSFVVLNKINTRDKVEEILNKNIKKVFPTKKNIRVVITSLEADSYMLDYDYNNNGSLDELGFMDNLVYYGIDSKNEIDSKCELSVKSLNIKNIEYSKDGYDFIGEIKNIKYGFYYYVVDNIPYVKKEKIK